VGALMVPVLVLGGQENALAIVRSLGRRGIPVHVAARADCLAFHSRHCGHRFPWDRGTSAASHFADLLLGAASDRLHGSVLFPCSDDAIEFVADQCGPLRERYAIPDFLPGLQRELLDKQRTLELARSAGVPVPNFWDLDSVAELESRRHEIAFPVMVKPLHSHLFQRAFGPRRFFTAADFDELMLRTRQVRERGLDAMVCEIIPGPDSLLSSYYTYLDGRGEHLFHFTKRVLRRYPMNQGGGCYHVTEWLPETAELGQRFFRGIGFRGLGNIEFKRDPRDDTLKVIECNARFTAAQWLLVRAGIDIAHLIYCHVTGRPVPTVSRYREHRRLWYPLEDYWAFRELQAQGLLTAWGWLRSVLRPHVTPYFTLGDPVPSLVALSRVAREKVRNELRALRGGRSAPAATA
jgi:predicted ATP-grasp superfamily ATP-dependent carboligase